MYIVKNSYYKKNVIDKKVNIKKVVIDVYLILKPHCNSVDDKLILDKLIEDLHTSKQILKVSRIRYYYKLLKNHLFLKKE